MSIPFEVVGARGRRTVPSTKCFEAKIKCRDLGAIGISEDQVLFMIRHEGDQPTIAEVIQAASRLGYQDISVRAIYEVPSPVDKFDGEAGTYSDPQCSTCKPFRSLAEITAAIVEKLR